MKRSFKDIWKSNLYVRIGMIALAAIIVIGSGVLIIKNIGRPGDVPADDPLATGPAGETPTSSQNGTAIGQSLPYPMHYQSVHWHIIFKTTKTNI